MRQAAKVERRSLNSQAIRWLENGAAHWEDAKDLQRVVAAIRERRQAMVQRHGTSTDSVELVRRTEPPWPRLKLKLSWIRTSL